jgi:hypothetical protein
MHDNSHNHFAASYLMYHGARPAAAIVSQQKFSGYTPLIEFGNASQHHVYMALRLRSRLTVDLETQVMAEASLDPDVAIGIH